MIENVNIDVVPQQVDVEVLENTDIELTVNKREFNIVGDNVYIAKVSETPPQWLADIVNSAVQLSISSTMTELRDLKDSILDELNVVKNQYTMAINQIATSEASFVSAVETLNATYQDTQATIANIQTTYATKDQASATALGIVQSELQDGAIAAEILTLKSTFVTPLNATSSSLEYLESTIGDPDTGVGATATAVSGLYTTVGLDGSGAPDGTGLLASVEILQKQNDGVIETVTGTHDVMLGTDELTFDLVNEAEPYASWLAAEEDGKELVRASHVGDVYIKYSESNGIKTYLAAYKFVKTVVDNTSPYATDTKGYTWAIVTDTDTQNAYMAALRAYDLADGKRRVFTSTPYAPYDVGDLWVDNSSTYKVIKVYNGSTWVMADEQVASFVNTTYTPTIATLQGQIDGKIEYYFRDSDDDPSTWLPADNAKHSGDIWYQTDTKESYYYDGVVDSWNLIEDAKAIQAISDAANAQSTADGKMSVYFAIQQDTTPTAPGTTIEGNTVPRYWAKPISGKPVLYKYTTSWVVANDIPLEDGDELKTMVVDTVNDTVDYYIYEYSVGNGWLLRTKDGLVAKSGWAVNLDAYIKNPSTGEYGGTSVLKNEVAVQTNGAISSAFAYNSEILDMYGNKYTAGFGLNASVPPNTNTNGDGEYDSEFWINADKFKMTNNTGATPNEIPVFSIDTTDGNKVQFNGKVTFGNSVIDTVNTANTIIDGGKIATGTIDASSIKANTITADKINTTGLIADNISGINIYGKTITGGSINGATITGAVIKTSWLDLTSTGYLTDWKYFSPGNPPPSQYTANFAKDATTGQLIVDSDGYHRLPKTKTAVFSGTNVTISPVIYQTVYPADVNFDIISYDDYTINSANRVLRARPKFKIQSGASQHLLMTTWYSWDRHDIYVMMTVGSNQLVLRSYANDGANTQTIYSQGTLIHNAAYTPFSYNFTYMGLSFTLHSFRFISSNDFGGGNYHQGFELYLNTSYDALAQSYGYIQFTEDFTASILLKFHGMYLYTHHDGEIYSNIKIYPPTFIEVYDE